VILAIGLSLFYLPLALVSKWGITAYPLIYILLEEVRNRFPFGGFGWVRIAFTQADAPYAKVAAIGGATALSAAVVFISDSSHSRKYHCCRINKYFDDSRQCSPIRFRF
jgi:apolipoprotein N-acyltransferase